MKYFFMCLLLCGMIQASAPAHGPGDTGSVVGSHNQKGPGDTGTVPNSGPKH